MAQNLQCNIDPKSFPKGKCPSFIKDNFGRTWKYSHTDDKGLCCYFLVVGISRRKKKVLPCECLASISVSFPMGRLYGNPLRYDYTTSPCAISASISNDSMPPTATINAPPASGSITLTSLDAGYPSSSNSISTITVVTDTGTCSSSVNVPFLSPP